MKEEGRGGEGREYTNQDTYKTDVVVFFSPRTLLHVLEHS